MNYVINALIGFSILIAGIILMLRIKKFDRAFDPFVFFVWLGCFNEILSFILLKNGFYTAPNNNIYVLIASIILLWFFKRMDIFAGQKYLFPSLISLYIIVWIVETLVLGSIDRISAYFRVLFSFLTVLFSISLINRLIVNSTNLLREGTFWICIGFITYFTLKVLVEIFFLYGISNLEFQTKVFTILIYELLFTNLSFALAALWIKKKHPYSLQ